MQLVLINGHAIEMEKRWESQEINEGNLRFTIYYKSLTATVNGFSNSNNNISNLVIPSKVNGPYNVTAIGLYAFQNIKNLRSVTIPSTVSNIKAHAFEGCTRLNSVYLQYPYGGRMVGYHAFPQSSSVSLYFTDFAGRYSSSVANFNNSFKTDAEKTKYYKEVLRNYKNHYFDADAAINTKKPYIKYENGKASVDNFYEQLAHALYSDPVFSGRNDMNMFMIDFRTTTRMDHTYWALHQWRMDLSYLKYLYKDITIQDAGFAYAGLQFTTSTSEPRSIMSFWNIKYNNGKKDVTITPTPIYPKDCMRNFSNEGTGTNCIHRYEFDYHKWYTVVYRSWNEIVDHQQTTFVAQWIKDASKEQVWTLVTVYDTHVPYSHMLGTAFFQENYSTIHSDAVRTFNIKGMYYRYGSSKFNSLNTAKLSVDRYAHTKGRFDYGVSDDKTYFYGSAGGSIYNQADYEEQRAGQRTYTIKQDSEPKTDALSVASAYYKVGSDNYATVYVKLNPYSSPFYRIDVYYESGSTSGHEFITDPTFESYKITQVKATNIKIRVIVYDIFDHKTEINLKKN